MKTEITIPAHFPELKKEDIIAADIRREKYTLLRDLQAKEYNEAILSRLAKDKEMLEISQRENRNHSKCEKCGKDFSAETVSDDLKNCPECN